MAAPVATTENEALTPSQTTASEGWVVMVMDEVITVKTVALVAMFDPTVTVIVPVAAPVGTVVVMLVDVLAVATAVVPLNFTILFDRVGSKFEPKIVTGSPTIDDVGVNEVIVGVGIKTKPGLVAVPPGVVTDKLPVAPAPTIASIEVVEVKVNELAGVPPKLTPVAPVKSVPVMVTEVPTGPLAGVKLVMVGTTAVTVKLPELVAVLHPAVTLIVPVVAPVGTVVVIVVVVLKITVAGVPLNVITLFAATASKFDPVITMAVPSSPLVGVKLVIVGPGEIALRNTDTLKKVVTAKSGFPSPSKSQIEPD